MSERPPFDLGISELAAEKEESYNPEFPTALAYFESDSLKNLYEGAGYIWRKNRKDDALGWLSDDIRLRVEKQDTVATLRAIAESAEHDFGLLSAHGIRFDGKFIVHDVNGVPALVSLVPKVEDYSRAPKEHLATPEAWNKYVSAFIRLRRGLLEYFDVNVAQDLPILWDIGIFSQYAYRPNESRNDFEFVLIDPDYKCESGRAKYRKFISNSQTAIAKMIGQIEQSGHTLRPELNSELAELLEEYKLREKELRKM